MLIKITLTFYLMLMRLVEVDKTNNSSCWWGCRVKGKVTRCYWECKVVQPLLKSVWQFFRKLELDLFQNPAIPVLAIHLKDVLSHNRDICSTMFISTLFSILRNWKQPRCLLTDEWLRKCDTFKEWNITQVLKSWNMKFTGIWMVIQKTSWVRKPISQIWHVIYM